MAIVFLLIPISLIYFDYRGLGIVIACIFAVIGLTQWNSMRRRGQGIDFNSPTRSGNSIRREVYLILSAAYLAVAAFGYFRIK